MSDNWTPKSWRAKPAVQMPNYPDPKALASVEEQLRSHPPLVFAGEARNLKDYLAAVSRGCQAGWMASRRRRCCCWKG